ncbi:hypothetical protein [Actinomadura nitritigenes]|uniref:hypothetical protein n=1 Tax=Actinomadura nitritigenes TaxID=134602 RepID=UPI003D949C8F
MSTPNESTFGSHLQPSNLLQDLAGPLVKRGWTCAFVVQERPVLRVWPPGAHPDPQRMAEIIICGDAGKAYFAYSRTPNRQIAPTGDVDRAVRAIVHVHGGTFSSPPAIPPGLITLFTDADGELP